MTISDDLGPGTDRGEAIRADADDLTQHGHRGVLQEGIGSPAGGNCSRIGRVESLLGIV